MQHLLHCWIDRIGSQPRAIHSRLQRIVFSTSNIQYSKSNSRTHIYQIQFSIDCNVSKSIQFYSWDILTANFKNYYWTLTSQQMQIKKEKYLTQTSNLSELFGVRGGGMLKHSLMSSCFSHVLMLLHSYEPPSETFTT